MKRFLKKINSGEEIVEKSDLTRFKSFIDYSSSPFFQSNLDGDFLYVNQAFAKLLSYFSKTDLLELSLKQDLFSDIKIWKNFLEQLKKKTRLEDFEIKLFSKSKELVTFKIDVRIVLGEGGDSSFFEGIAAKSIVVDKDLERKSKDIESQSKDLESKYKDLENKYKDLDNKNKEIESQSKDFESQIKDLESTSKDLENLNKDFENQNKELESKSNDFENKSNDLESQIKDLEDQSKDLENQNKNFENQNKDIESHSKDLESQIKDLVNKYKDLENQNKDLENQSKDFENQNKNIEGHSKDLASKIKDLENQSKDLENQSKDLENQNKNIESHSKDLASQIKDLESQNKDLESQNKDLENQSKDFENQNKELESHSNDLESQIKDLENQSKDLENQSKDFENQNKNIESHSKDLESKYKDLENKYKDLENQNKDLENQSKDLENQNKGLENQNKDLESKNKELESKDKNLENKEKGLASKSKDLESKIKDLENQNKDLEGKSNGLESENKDLDQELKELRKKEKSATSQVYKANYTKNVKSQYLANMTHEIKTPINSIVGFLTLIEQKLFDNEEELQDFAHNARISADSLLEIINNILDISRIEAGKVELDEDEFNLSHEIEKAKAVALPAGGNSNIEITTNISDEISSEVIGDALRYRQVLINILVNSVKYTEAGNIDIIVEIDKVRESSVSIKTTVKDTGCGIPKEQLSILFKPYTQVKAKKWNKKDGSGLGLMICKEIVKLMDGEIIIKSKLGKGTIVEFTTLFKTTKNFKLPAGKKIEDKSDSKNDSQFELVDTESKEVIEEKTEELTPKNGDAKSVVDEKVKSSDFTEQPRSDVKRILLVEDNPISQKVELKLLKQTGYVVEAVSNGYDAIEAVKTNSFSLVLMDVEMAELDGLESTKRIRALKPPTSNIPIIAVTAHSSMKDREKCLTAGMNDYIAKPININFMRMIIDHWLRREVSS